MEIRDNGPAIGAMLVANAAFLLNDTLVKFSSDNLPLGQMIFVRGAICIVLLAIVCQVTGVFRSARLLIHPMVLLRTLAEVCATLLYLTALMRMPIANATSILQALPLVVTAAAAIFLKAPVGWRRWTAIGVGLTGVMLIIRPGFEGFDAWALVALAGVMFMAIRDLSTRQMPEEIPTYGVSLMTAVGVTIMGAGLSVSEGWQPMALQDYLSLSGAAGFILFGYIFIILAMRSGDISVVAPFRYSAVLWALAIGFLVWGEVPDAMTIIGTTIIILTGIYSFWRERRLSGG
ncbi:DMT family transporter [Roseibium polysiphoniae]|uniref:DMT family transporter n=1 Tax=Roseibium polysiphoniae TaxID=2571221 RepID=A0ABR9C568_9HYPH|nr:DMT family transporter [Roseibium polysiphoniae]MBD8875019.1 DMT family transporter [Roseibium polysiphoniae]